MRLHWQPGFSLSRKPQKRARASRLKLPQPVAADGSPHFEFIAEHPLQENNEPSRSALTASSPAYLVAPSGFQQDAVDYSHGSSDQDRPMASESHLPIGDSASPIPRDELRLRMIPGNLSPWPISSGSSTTDDLAEDSSCVSHLAIGTATYPAASTPDTGMQLFIKHDTSNSSAQRNLSIAGIPFNVKRAMSSIPPSVLYNDIVQQYRQVCDRYDQEFCTIPLTSDLVMNPFRCRANPDAMSMFLLHAIMALAGHHVESAVTQDHRHNALRLLREKLDMNELAKTRTAMLDTIIVLFSLDEATSAFGNWNTHLLGAYTLLESCGGIDILDLSTRLGVQVALLVWWDALLNLMSREDCIFPYPYFEATFCHQKDYHWDYFGLVGCPANVVVVIMQAVRLAAEKRKCSMQRVAFDNKIILQLEQDLESWRYTSPETATLNEESMHQDQDNRHGSEAWRLSIQLYIYRVFHWTPGDAVPMWIAYSARLIIDHVFACRDDSMVPKQALLPVFLAGCELQDVSTRRKIVRFCYDWSARTNYHLFETMPPLMDEIWAEQDTYGLSNAWWGSVVDRHHSARSCPRLKTRICFG